MRKRLIAIGFIVALAVSAVLPATALAGGTQGKGNGTSDQENLFGVCHKFNTPAEKVLWLPNQEAQDAHLGHGDLIAGFDAAGSPVCFDPDGTGGTPGGTI